MHLIPLTVVLSELTSPSSFCGVVNLLVHFRVVWFWFEDFCLLAFCAVCIFVVSFEVFSKGLWDSLFEPGLPTLFIKREVKLSEFVMV